MADGAVAQRAAAAGIAAPHVTAAVAIALLHAGEPGPVVGTFCARATPAPVITATTAARAVVRLMRLILFILGSPYCLFAAVCAFVRFRANPICPRTEVRLSGIAIASGHCS